MALLVRPVLPVILAIAALAVIPVTVALVATLAFQASLVLAVGQVTLAFQDGLATLV